MGEVGHLCVLVGDHSMENGKYIRMEE